MEDAERLAGIELVPVEGCRDRLEEARVILAGVLRDAVECRRFLVLCPGARGGLREGMESARCAVFVA